MSNEVIAKWLKKDSRQRKVEYFDRLEFELEFEGLLFSEYQNLLKEHTVTLKGGIEKFEDEDFTYALIAKTIKKADGVEIDLFKKETVEAFEATDIRGAIDKMFTAGEVNKVAQVARELAGMDKKKEAEEVEELKN